MDAIEISGRRIAPDTDPYIVAEIGQNHNGDAYTAIRMVGMAYKCGCDAVKFQLRDAEAEIAAGQLLRPHPEPSKAFGDTYLEHRKALDFTPATLRHISERIRYNEWPIHWFATPCYLDAVQKLEDLNVPAYKIASKDLTNLPLIEEAAQTKKPLILSTGMANLRDIEEALNVVFDHHDKVVVMQCTSQYPCPDENAHLAAMVTIRDTFDVLVGFSDHTVGILAPSIATAMGAVIIEKHITLSRAMPGSDHAGAVEEEGLRRIVRDCKAVTKLIGNLGKELIPETDYARVKLAGSLVTKRRIEPGELIKESDLTLKAPGDGLKWSQRDFVIGRRAVRGLEPDEQVRTSDVE